MAAAYEKSTENLITGYLVAEEVNLSVNESPAVLAERITERQDVTLLSFIRMLGSALVADSATRRARGIGLLVATISRLPPSAVNRQEARHLVDYLTNESCLGTTETLVQSIDGLSALAKLPVFGQGDTIQVFRALVKNIDMRMHHQAVRFVVYQLIDLLMSTRRMALKSMGAEFLKGYTTLVEGEKDPRNLKLAFSLDRVMLLEFDITEALEELFDITFCYFPITFTPPPDDPYGISSEELQTDLRTCLASTPLFGPLALPLILDKLQASTKSAKTQSLEAICTCFPVYGKAAVGEYAKTFWEALNLEVFNATDTDMETLATRAMRAFLATLYPDPPITSVPVEDVDMLGDAPEASASSVQLNGVASLLLHDVFHEIEKSPDKSSAQAATKILAAAVSATNVLSAYVLASVLPSLLKMLQDPEHASVRPQIIGHLGTLLSAHLSLSSADSKSLALIKDELISILASASQAPTTAIAALHVLAVVCRVPHFLSAQEKSFVVSCFNDNLKPDSDPEVAASALVELSNISDIVSRETCERTLPQLFSQLPDTIPTNTRYTTALNALAQLCTPTELFESLVIRVLGRLDQAAILNEDIAALYCHHLLVTLRNVVMKKLNLQHPDLTQTRHKLLPRLFGLFLRTDITDGCWKNPRLCLDASDVITLFVQSMATEDQKSLLSSIEVALNPTGVSTGFDNKWSNLALNFTTLPESTQINAVVLYAAIVKASRPEAFGPSLSLHLCQMVWQKAMSWTDDVGKIAAFKTLAVCSNKSPNALDQFLQDTTSAVSLRSIAQVHGIAWLARGLATRSDARGFAYAEQLLELCGDPTFGSAAGRAIGVVTEDKDGLLVKENHAIIRLLYRQRLCSTLLRLIVSHSKAGEESVDEANRLVALSVLLRNLPKQMILTELPKFMTLLLRALEIPDADLCAYVVDTLGLMAAESPDTITPHTSTLIAAFVKASTSSPSPKLRSAALRALAVFPETIPYLSLQAHKTTVLKGLSKAVDDRKKSVRKDAVDCRETWYRLQAP